MITPKRLLLSSTGMHMPDAQKLYYKLNGGKLFGKIWVFRLPEDKDIADLQGDLTNYQPFQID